MCRHLAYLGPEITLEELLLTPEHSLLRQAWEPRHQTHGVVNADGFGAGWYDLARRSEPARYRSDRPIWTDRSFASLAGLVRSTAVLAAVRSASPGMPVEESASAPFTSGPWLFSHNGIVPGFYDGARRDLAGRLSGRRAEGVLGATDSEILFALVLDRLDAGASPGEALAQTVKTVESLAAARTNLLLTDGHRIAATAWRNSLFVLYGRPTTSTVVVASEPHDADPAWQRVTDGSLVEVDGATTTVTAL